jgi:hypothetical protein
MFYDFLAIIDFGLVALETLFHLVHMVLVRVYKLSFLSFKHCIDFVFEIVSKGVKSLDEFFDFLSCGLCKVVFTLYL